MKCPRCGADNGDQAEWCSLCQYNFSGTQDASGPSGNASQPEQSGTYGYQPLPGAYPQSGLGQIPDYPPLPPGMQPPGMQPQGYGYPPPKKGLSTGAKTLIGIMAVLVFFALAGAAAYLILGKSATIYVSPPPGWQAASEEVTKNVGKAFQDKNLTVDYVFSSDTLSDIIMVYHGQSFTMQTPSTGSYNDVKDFFDKHRDEYIKQMTSSYDLSGVTWNINKEEIVEMVCGISAIHMSVAASANGKYVSQDLLIFYKGSKEYAALVNTAGSQSNTKEIDHLEKNISFK